jgi:TolA-binding protein
VAFINEFFSGDDTRLELEEYQESSREVEAELETQLKQSESQVRELRTANQRLQMEYMHLKVMLKMLK